MRCSKALSGSKVSAAAVPLRIPLWIQPPLPREASEAIPELLYGLPEQIPTLLQSLVHKYQCESQQKNPQVSVCSEIIWVTQTIRFH